jgi:hypothetical protein
MLVLRNFHLLRVCFITVAIVLLLRDFGLHGIILQLSLFTTIDFPVILYG